jgi:hypothetical protein
MCIFPSFLLILLCFRLPLSDDPDLAMAFSIARRAAAVPLLLVNGTYRKTIRTYLDSSILQYQLQRLNKHGSLKGILLMCSFTFRMLFVCTWKQKELIGLSS